MLSPISYLLPMLAGFLALWSTGPGNVTKEQLCFIILFTLRYLRLVVNTIAHWKYKSKAVLNRPSFFPKDVTVILPTISTDLQELEQTIRSILRCNPAYILVVTPKHLFETTRKFFVSIGAKNLSVHESQIASKRIQVSEAIPLVTTPITVMVDDDVTWPEKTLLWLLAPFEDGKMGGVGTCQRVKRLNSGTFKQLCFNFLGAVYIQRRNFEISATHEMDGGTSCMSGRTCAFRTDIFRDPDFLCGYTTEKWNGYPLKADDDNFITRWLVAKGWKTWIQYSPECEIETTLEDNVKFLYQCARWARSNWRSNWTSLTAEHIFWKQPWSTYALHLTMFWNFAIIVDPLLFWLCYKSTSSHEAHVQTCSRLAFLIWWLATKSVKLVVLFRHNIEDIWFLPISILFGYFHSFIKLYALCTLNETGWGSR